ncbi:hypothetical protein MTE01_20350 [Microbacterium testaceum]|uniref:Uncharacterized protein n=1 Tax=Microbacterium testaceum TaxID=2033 RepID=A0A4Y3QPQ4_MICTE|nr:hypothetical protein [Microbacterium testaceum]GEB46090.1 hypothetical protein MTE01_20350 [Microbacterium testaceum]
MRVQSLKNATLLAVAGLLVVGFIAIAAANPVVGMGMLAATVYIAWAIKHPTSAGAAWIFAVAVVPQWWSFSIPGIGSVGFTTAVGVALALALLVGGAGRGAADRYVAIFAVLVLAAVGLALLATDLQSFIVRDFLLVWIVPAFVGVRLAPTFRTTLPVVGAIIGVWSVLELATGLHVFETFGQVSTWQTIQYRGAFARSEAAFGTPIALGAFLALALPFVTYLRRGRALATILIVAGVLATISRSPLIAVLVVGVLLVYRLATIRVVVAAALAAVVLGVLAGPLFGSDDAGADTAGSNFYRENAINAVIGTLRPIGLADGAYVDPRSGSLLFTGFNSIDSAVLLTGLVIGWLPLILAALAIIPVVVTALRRKASPEEIAFLAQLTMVASLAFITGWQIMFFALVGVVMSQRADRRARVTSTA